MDGFDERIKNIERELLALKTSSLYTSIRNVNTAAFTVRTGRYRINYVNNGGAIISEAYSNKQFRTNGTLNLLTPQGSSQIIEVDTTYINQNEQVITYDVSLYLVSNAPVVSITRIS